MTTTGKTLGEVGNLLEKLAYAVRQRDEYKRIKIPHMAQEWDKRVQGVKEEVEPAIEAWKAVCDQDTGPDPILIHLVRSWERQLRSLTPDEVPYHEHERVDWRGEGVYALLTSNDPALFRGWTPIETFADVSYQLQLGHEVDFIYESDLVWVVPQEEEPK